MKPPKAQFVNTKTYASNPGKLRVQFLAWARCFRKESGPGLCVIAIGIVLRACLGVFVQRILRSQWLRSSSSLWSVQRGSR